MNDIELMLTGKLDMPLFITKLKTDKQLQEQIRNLVPKDAIDNREHPFWEKISYSVVRSYNYNYIKFLSALCRFNGTIGDNLDIWSIIQRGYYYWNPTLVCTNKYRDAHGLYLDAIGDYYGGPETNHIIEKIIAECLQTEGKGKRIKQAKQAIVKAFHTEDKKRPWWIQGAEWPMGKISPMKFIERKRFGESVCYYFVDVDTGELRTVKQWY